MPTANQLLRRSQAAAKLQQLCVDIDASQLVDSLAVGLTHLREVLLTRIHHDVESYFGMDSMLAPLSAKQELEELWHAKVEIEIYSAVVVDDEMKHHICMQPIHNEPTNHTFLDWLIDLRMGEGHAKPIQQRLSSYAQQTPEERRLQFVDILERVVPEASKAPLVIHRLFPRAARIVTATAFGDPLRAQELRAQQQRYLPAIGDCHDCHGRVLDNEEKCRTCGNPLWNFSWLRAAD